MSRSRCAGSSSSVAPRSDELGTLEEYLGAVRTFRKRLRNFLRSTWPIFVEYTTTNRPHEARRARVLQSFDRFRQEVLDTIVWCNNAVQRENVDSAQNRLMELAELMVIRERLTSSPNNNNPE